MPGDSLPGHTELIWLQVCSLTPTARFSRDISRPSRRRAVSRAALGVSRWLGRRNCPRRFPLRSHLPRNAAIRRARDERKGERAPAAPPSPLLLFQVHRRSLSSANSPFRVTLSKSPPLSRPSLFQLQYLQEPESSDLALSLCWGGILLNHTLQVVIPLYLRLAV